MARRAAIQLTEMGVVPGTMVPLDPTRTCGPQSRFGNGAIGYDEYAYPLNAHIPVLKLRNPAGKYVLPTAASVTTALTQAVINTNPHSRNFLQQSPDKVYTFTNPRSYPLASYSYLIVPREGTTLPANFTKAKGRTLSAFVAFALCQGQHQLSQVGYAPLPSALVDGGLRQAARIPGHGPVPSPSQCPQRQVAAGSKLSALRRCWCRGPKPQSTV